MLLDEITQKFSDPSTERNINSVICQFGREVFEDIDDLITPSTFTINHNQAVYKCLKYIYENSDRNENVKVDNSLLLATAKTLGYTQFLSEPKEIKLVDRLFEMPVEPTNGRKLAAYARKLEIRRLIAKQLNLGLVDLENIPNDTPIEELIASVEGRILDFTSLLSDDAQQVREIGSSIDDYVNHLLENPCEILGVSSGYPHYDKAIGGGFRRKSVNIIGARAKAGKSMLSINIGLHVASKLNIPVLYLDTEMSLEDQYSRMLANLSKVEINDIETGKFGKNRIKKSKITEAASKMKQIPFDYCSIAGKPFEEIFSIMRKWVTKKVGYDENGRTNNCLIIFDYLKLMSSDSITQNIQEYQALGFLLTNLHNFMVKYDVPCLAFMQLNRDGVTKEGVEAASGSDRIIWLCSNFSIYKQKAEEDLEECSDKYGTRKLVPVIARHGEGLAAGDYINFFFSGKTATVKEGKTYLEIKSSGENSDDTGYISDEISDNDIDETYASPPWE